MGFYAYRGDAVLGKETCGTDDKFLRKDLTTDRGAIRAATKFYGTGPFVLYRFYNFYDPSTFREIWRQK